MPDGAATAHLLRPKLITILQEGYGLAFLRSDLIAAATVAVVALPLSMAIAVASGVSPERGLYTAIVGGFVVSALTGSRFQIGGPAGAFIVLVSATVAAVGLQGTFVAVLLSGIMLTLLGLFRIGGLIRYIPHAVTVGFTCGVAVTILASQIKDLSGIRLETAEPAALLPKIAALAHAAPTFNAWTLGLGVGVAAAIYALRKLRPAWPGMLIAIAVSALLAALLHLPVETIGTRFGGIPHSLPQPSLPALSWARLVQTFPAALSFTLLGAIESLLSAKVADGMTGRRHRSNMELIGQGVANIASACFGGICVTGTIARTATNIRAGAKSPISGMAHSGILLLFMMIAAPLAGFIPLASLAGVLVIVALNMVEADAFGRLLRAWPSAVVVIATLGVTLAKDLMFGIAAGCAVAAIFYFLGRPSALTDA